MLTTWTQLYATVKQSGQCKHSRVKVRAPKVWHHSNNNSKESIGYNMNQQCEKGSNPCKSNLNEQATEYEDDKDHKTQPHAMEQFQLNDQVEGQRLKDTNTMQMD